MTISSVVFVASLMSLGIFLRMKLPKFDPGVLHLFPSLRQGSSHVTHLKKLCKVTFVNIGNTFATL